MTGVKLVTISAYSKQWGIARSTVYDLIEKKVITRYESPEGEPLLDAGQHPKGVQKHKNKDPEKNRKRKIT